VKGTIYQNLTWPGGVYEVVDEVIVRENATLTMQPGVEVKAIYESDWDSHTIWGREGQVQIEGATLKGVQLQIEQGSNWLRSCTVQGIERSWGTAFVIIAARNDSSLEITGGDFSDVDIRLFDESVGSISGNKRFHKSSFWVIRTTDLEIRDNLFIDSFISVTAKGAVEIANNTFRALTEGQYVGWDSIFANSGGDQPIVIRHNNFFLNAETSAIYISPYNENTVTVEGNRIDVCSKGIAIGTSSVTYDEPKSPTFIIDNVVSGCEYGAEIYTGKSTFTGNTIVKNETGVFLNFGLGAGATSSLQQNCIAGNSPYGLRAYTPSFELKAESNWWGHVSGPKNESNPGGTGDPVFANNVDFTPWLTVDNCEVTANPWEFNVTADPEELLADGESTATITVLIKDGDGLPVEGNGVAIDLPLFGSINPLSGQTDGNGTFTAVYTAPSASELNGKDYVDLDARDTSSGLEGYVRIAFKLPWMTVWAEPNMPSYSEEMAIIPPDERFPAKYTVTIRDPANQPISGKNVTVSIQNTAIARLDGGGMSGREIVITTNAEGKAIFTYAYLGVPSRSAPFEDTITLKSKDLGLEKYVKVSVGLDIQIDEVNEMWQANVIPAILGMRIKLKDQFRPEMNLFNYVKDLEKATGHEMGFRLTTEWLNRPKEEWFELISTHIKGFRSPSNNELYNGGGRLFFSTIYGVIIEAFENPQLKTAFYTLPAIKFHSEGLHIMMVKVHPIIIHEDGSDYTDFVKQSGLSNMYFFATDVYRGESILKSLTCSFKPTNRDQFIAKTLILDNPLLTTAVYVGSGAAAPIAIALKIVSVANILCDFMEGNYATAAAGVLSLYISNLKEKLEGIENLTSEQLELLAKINQLNFHMNAGNAMNDAYTHFSKTKQSLLETMYYAPLQLTDSDEWPEDITLEEFIDAVTDMLAGGMSNTVMEGLENVIVIGSGAVSVTYPDGSPLPEDAVFMDENQEVHVYLVPEKTGLLSVLSDGRVNIFRHLRTSKYKIEKASYEIFAGGVDTKMTLDLTGDIHTVCNIDEGNNGSIDRTMDPETTGTISPCPPGDVNGDGLIDLDDADLAFKILTGVASIEPVDAKSIDVNGDQKIGEEEVFYILQYVSGFRQ
jgi:hypothetical protein